MKKFLVIVLVSVFVVSGVALADFIDLFEDINRILGSSSNQPNQITGLITDTCASDSQCGAGKCCVIGAATANDNTCQYTYNTRGGWCKEDAPKIVFQQSSASGGTSGYGCSTTLDCKRGYCCVKDADSSFDNNKCKSYRHVAATGGRCEGFSTSQFPPTTTTTLLLPEERGGLHNDPCNTNADCVIDNCCVQGASGIQTFRNNQCHLLTGLHGGSCMTPPANSIPIESKSFPPLGEGKAHDRCTSNAYCAPPNCCVTGSDNIHFNNECQEAATILKLGPNAKCMGVSTSGSTTSGQIITGYVLSPSQYCPDINLDGVINDADVSIMYAAYDPGGTNNLCPSQYDCDMNNDGVVDLTNDILPVISAQGSSPSDYGCPISCPSSSSTCLSPVGSISCGQTLSGCLNKADRKYYFVPNSAGKNVQVTVTYSGNDCNINDLVIYVNSCTLLDRSDANNFIDTWIGTPVNDISIVLDGDTVINENCQWSLNVNCAAGTSSTTSTTSSSTTTTSSTTSTTLISSQEDVNIVSVNIEPSTIGFHEEYEVECIIDRTIEEGLDCVWLESCGGGGTYIGFEGWTGNVATHVCMSDSQAGTFQAGCKIQGGTESNCIPKSTVTGQFVVQGPDIGVPVAYLDVVLDTPPELSSNNVIQNNTFTVTANVTCVGGSCGNVNGRLGYAASPSEPSTPISTTSGATPFSTNTPTKITLSTDFDGYATSTGSKQTTSSNFVGITEEGIKGRAFIRFNLSNLPSGGTITDVKLTVNQIDNQASQLWVDIQAYDQTGQTDPEPDSAAFAYSRGGNDPTPYIDDSTGLQTLGIKTINLPSTAYIDIQNAKTAVNRFTIAFNEDGTSSGPPGTRRTALESLEGGPNHAKLNITYILSATNLQSCGLMSAGQTCQLNWTVNATGAIGSSWNIDTLFTSDTIASNDTGNAQVNITTSTTLEACPPIITPAVYPPVGLCYDFPTPCDVPEGWVVVESCGEGGTSSTTSTTTTTITDVCPQVITPAINSATGFCLEFSTPCDVREGWVVVASCEGEPLFNETTPVVTCIDSDDGINYSVKGNVTIATLFDGVIVDPFSFVSISQDNCNLFDTNILHELYCTGGSPLGGLVDYACPNGCVDGACIPAPQAAVWQWLDNGNSDYAGTKTWTTIGTIPQDSTRIAFAVWAGEDDDLDITGDEGNYDVTFSSNSCERSDAPWPVGGNVEGGCIIVSDINSDFLYNSYPGMSITECAIKYTKSTRTIEFRDISNAEDCAFAVFVEGGTPQQGPAFIGSDFECNSSQIGNTCTLDYTTTLEDAIVLFYFFDANDALLQSFATNIQSGSGNAVGHLYCPEGGTFRAEWIAYTDAFLTDAIGWVKSNELITVTC